MSLKSVLSNQWCKHLLKALVSLGLVAYLVHAVDFGNVRQAWVNANWVGIGISTALTLMGTVYLQALEIHSSMRSGSRISVFELCKINLTQMFYLLFLPAGVTFVIRWRRYQRAGYGGYDSVALVGFHKVLQLAVGCLFALGSLAYLGRALGPYENELLISALICSVVLGAGLALVLGGGAGAMPALLARMGIRGRSGEGWGVRLNNRLVHIIEKGFASLAAFSELDRRDMWIVMLFGVLQHLAIVLSGWVIVEMLIPGVSFAAVMLIRSLVVIFMLLPISVGGLGVRELAFFTLFPMFGVPAATALTSSLLLFLVQIIVAALGGLLELFDFLRPIKRVARSLEG